MPIISQHPLNALDRENFGKLSYEAYGQKLVNYTDVDALLWANIGRHHVILRCIIPER